MESIYNLVQESPKFYTWVFGVINILCVCFVYFNKQSHDRNLKRLEQDLKYKAERRLKIFDLKATQYSQYVTDLDSFGKKNQVDVPKKMQPIIDEYMQRYLAASGLGDESQIRKVIGWFSAQISALMQEGLHDVLKLKYESNRLKLIATDEMLETFDKIEKLNEESMEHANEFMKSFTEIILKQQVAKTEEYQVKAKELADETKRQSQNLLNQMRKEISDI